MIALNGYLTASVIVCLIFQYIHLFQACPRGYQPDDDNTSICSLCEGEPGFYDWLYLGFMVLLSLSLHWFFIDFTNRRKKWVCANINTFTVLLHRTGQSNVVSPSCLAREKFWGCDEFVVLSRSYRRSLFRRGLIVSRCCRWSRATQTSLFRYALKSSNKPRNLHHLLRHYWIGIRKNTTEHQGAVDQCLETPNKDQVMHWRCAQCNRCLYDAIDYNLNWPDKMICLRERAFFAE